MRKDFATTRKETAATADVADALAFRQHGPTKQEVQHEQAQFLENLHGAHVNAYEENEYLESQNYSDAYEKWLEKTILMEELDLL